jgi:ankyrin repeat protein
VNGKDNFGLAPVHHAVAVGSVEMVELLVQHKANLLAVSAQCNTVLHYAINNGPRAAAVLAWLRENHAEVVAECEKVRRSRACDVCVWCGSVYVRVFV